MKNLLFLMGVVLIFAGCDSSNNDLVIKGCTDQSSINYNPYATEDDGTCLTPQRKQFGFAINYTATWCGPCGNWGAPKIHELAEAGDVVAITNHADNDPMYIPSLYSSFASCRPTGGGIPSFWVGDVDDGEVSDMQALLAQTPDVGIEFIQAKEGNVMKVKTKVLFFENVTGDYYVSAYILESGIDGSETAGAYKQNGTSNPTTYKHDFVLRATSVPDQAYGEMIATGSIAKGTSVVKTYEIDLDPTWTNDVYVAVCVWKLDGSMYKFVNAIQKK